MIKIKMCNKAVSEILGSILLIAIAVSMFTIVYINVLSDPGPPPETYVTIVGKKEFGNVVFEHRRGEGVDINSKISLFYEGDELFNGKISELLNSESLENNKWDIGERLTFTPDESIIPTTFLDEVQINGHIVDKLTNSLIFDGKLQEGYVVPASGKGGIWHLDEESGNKAEDSSGNKNHGLIHGASRLSGRNNLALFFDSSPTDYVNVSSGPGLYITDEITIETWIHPLDTTSGIIDDFNFDNKSSGITWIHISGDIFAFAFWYQGEASQDDTNCRILTVNLAPYGQIGDTAIDTLDFIFAGQQGANGFDPDFIHIGGSVYAIAHRWAQDDGFITTFNISEDGFIDDSNSDRTSFEPNPPSNSFQPDIIHVSGNIYAIASSEYAIRGKGNIATVEIEPNGTINETVIDRFEFESGDCSYPRILKISDTKTKYIVAYGSFNNGYVKTIEIENNGSINQTTIDTFEFESNDCNETDLEFVSSDLTNGTNIYAIAYRGDNNRGWITTVEVNNNGFITKNVTDTRRFDPDLVGAQPDIEYITKTNHTFAIAYKGEGDYGYFTTFKIFDNGTISDLLDTFRFTRYTQSEMYPSIVHVSDIVYGITYKGKAGKGYLITIAMSEGGIIEGMEGHGGIFKDRSYGLKANGTMAFATINNYTINLTGIVANSWNHIALTYDGAEMRLYINNNINVSYIYPWVNNNEIYFNEFDDLYFGYLFYGLLDEIAIFDRALSPDLIEYHFENPGDYRLSIPSIQPSFSISNIATTEISYNSVNISWDTNIASTSKVNYGISTSLGATKSEADLVKSHSIILTGLVPNQDYYFEVLSTQNENTITDNNNGFYYFFTTKDVIHVEDIQMSYDTSGSKYVITTIVTITNYTNALVTGANVKIELTLPGNNGIEILNGNTFEGIATLVSKKYFYEGTYTSTIMNVENLEYIYESSFNKKDSWFIGVP